MGDVNKEMSALKSNDAYDLLKLPQGKRTVGSKWTYKREIKSDGPVERYKARFVVQGFTQRAGQD